MSNPILNEQRFRPEATMLEGAPMTIQGTVNKIFMLFICMLAGAGFYVYLLANNPMLTKPVIGISCVLATICVFVSCYNAHNAKYVAPPYALFEGIVLGGFSLMFESFYHGIVFQAILATIVVLFFMLFLYKIKAIRYTQKFATVLLVSTLSILVIYLIQFVAMFFTRSIPLIWQAGIVGIAFSAFVVIIASLSLIQDFYFIETASGEMLSKDYEWQGALGIMVTLVWLYTEILRLLAKLNSRD